MDWSRLFPEMSPALKRYYWRSLLPSLAFVLLVLVRVPALDVLAEGSPWRIAVGLLPLAAWLWILREYARFLRACDELERRIELGALVAAMGVGVSVSLALLLALDVRAIALDAERAVGLAALVPLVVFSIARHVLHRHYR
jgi:hypothetical protein